MTENAVRTPLKCVKDTFREKEVSSFFSPKEKEGMSFPNPTSFEGQRALKAFYQHRPSAPANFNFFMSKPENTDLQMQSADSIFGDLVDEDDLSPETPIEPAYKPLPLSQSACYQIQEDVPMDVQLSLNSWWVSECLNEAVHGFRIPSVRNVEEHQRLRWSRARPMSFHLAGETSRRRSLSVDWTDIVSRLVTEPEKCTSNCNTSKQTSAEYLKPCSVNSSKHEHCKPETVSLCFFRTPSFLLFCRIVARVMEVLTRVLIQSRQVPRASKTLIPISWKPQMTKTTSSMLLTP